MTHLLAIDPDSGALDTLENAAAQLGMSTTRAADVADALAQLDAGGGFDVIVIDAKVGFERGAFTDELRRRSLPIPVLATTSDVQTTHIAALLRQGVRHVLFKPFRADALPTHLQRAVKVAQQPAAQLPGLATAPPRPSHPPPGVATPSSGFGPGPTRIPNAAVPSMAGARPAGLPGSVPGAARPNAASPSAPAPARSFAAAPAMMATPATGPQRDMLSIDDLPNVHARLKTLVGTKVEFDAATDAATALSLARENRYRLILVDADIPGTDTSVLVQQLSALQPSAIFIAMAVKGEAEHALSKTQRIESTLGKPFDSSAVEQLLFRHLDRQDVLDVDGEVLRFLPAAGGTLEERKDRVYRRAPSLFDSTLRGIADACFERAIADLRELPLDAERTPRLVLTLAQTARKRGLPIYLVLGAEGRRLLAGFKDTAELPAFDDLESAKGAQ